MYNLTEHDRRSLERIEESSMHQLFKTERGCPLYLLYLEGGQVPLRYIQKRNTLLFLQYLLKQNETSMIYKMLLAQEKDPKRGDWVSDTKKYLYEFKIKK